MPTRHLEGQATVSASASSGGAYSTISAANFNIEASDGSSSGCTAGVAGNHSAFGEHITQAPDAELGQNVFVFHSHIAEDSDRCKENGNPINRVRTEIKGGPSGNSDPELEHEYGDDSYTRWQFRLDPGFIGATSFCHLFQMKAEGGSDDGFPVLTLTARADRLEFLHNAGDGNPTGDLGPLVQADISNFRGKWVEVYVHVLHSNSGKVDLSVRDVATGTTIMSYSNANIDMFRGQPGDDVINRPKWGMYRSLNPGAGIRDESTRFANLCSSESAGSACPSILPAPPAAPSAVTNVLPVAQSINVPDFMPLSWTASPEATSYNVYLGTSPTPPLETSQIGTSYAPALEAATTYYFQIGAVNGIGETRNAIQSFTTLDDTDDGVWEIARGHARPEVEAPQFFTFDTNLSGTAEIDETKAIPGEPGNNAHTFFSTEGTTGNHRWRYSPDPGEEITLVIRLAPITANTNITYVDFRGLGFRQKANIKRTNVRFEQAPGTAPQQTVDFGGLWDDEAFHTLRFTYALDAGQLLTKLYVDEGITPFTSFYSSEIHSTSAYLDIGRAGSDNVGAKLDFIAINPTGAFAPESGGTSSPPGDMTFSETLPLHWVSPLSVTSLGQAGNGLSWGISDQRSSDFLTVERSRNVTTFESLKTIPADGNQVERRDFTLVDPAPQEGTAYYRIRQTDFDGSYTFSNVVAITPGQLHAYAVSPNPAHAELSLWQYPTVDLAYRIFSSLGTAVVRGKLPAGDRVLDVSLLSPGSYFLQTLTGNGTMNTLCFQKK